MESLIFVALVVIGAGILWNVRLISSRLSDFVETRAATVTGVELESLIEGELQRARRLGYPLSLLILRTKQAVGSGGPSNAAVLKLIAADSNAAWADDAPAGTINIFRNARKPVVVLRSTDMAVYDRQNNRFVMLLIGTAGEDARKMAQRIATTLTDRLGRPWTYGCAEFPGDDLIVEDLIATAEAKKKSISSEPATADEVVA